MTDPTALPEWAALAEHQRGLAGIHLRDLLVDDERAGALTFTVGDLVVDCAKHLVAAETMARLVALARALDLEGRIAALLAGERVNVTEGRAALHTALRAPRGTTLLHDGRDVVVDVHEVLDRAFQLADAVRSGSWRGATGAPIRTVVNLGIGGSDLGPVMAYEALRAFRHPTITCRFVSNVDGSDLAAALHGLDPAETLFVVSSKTFTTQETLANAHSARRWLVGALGDVAVARHFVAVSTNGAEVRAFGIDPTNMFGFWDWVGGRYSMDSAIGLSLMVAVGPAAFAELLAGFRVVDEHLAQAPLERNVPVLLGMLRVWYRNLWGYPTHAVLPYCRDLHRFPAYLQQLEMESNGKRVRADGNAVGYPTGPVLWGEPGTNGQHAFYQLLHQGTTVVPADFIAFVEPTDAVGEHHELLLANCLAQTQALALGKTEAEVLAGGVDPVLAPHKVFPGNRPTTTIVGPRLTPSTLGQLVALYEHTVYVQACVWGINPFDQWGVELGKVLAGGVLAGLRGGTVDGLDASTRRLIALMRGRTTGAPQ